MAIVHIANAKVGKLHVKIANPIHSIISPRWLGHEIYLKSPPYGILYPFLEPFLKLISIVSDWWFMYAPAKKTISPVIKGREKPT